MQKHYRTHVIPTQSYLTALYNVVLMQQQNPSEENRARVDHRLEQLAELLDAYKAKNPQEPEPVKWIVGGANSRMLTTDGLIGFMQNHPGKLVMFDDSGSFHKVAISVTFEEARDAVVLELDIPDAVFAVEDPEAGELSTPEDDARYRVEA